MLRKGEAHEPLVWLVSLAAILLIEKPNCLLRLAALGILQLAYLWTKLPNANNHMIILGYVNLSLLTLIGIQLWQNGLRKNGRLIPPVTYIKVTFLIGYLAAAVSKLNSDFFDPEKSCSVSMMYNALAPFGIQDGSLPHRIEAAQPYFITGMEFLIPLLLLMTRTRWVGIIVIIIFHIGISFSPRSTALDFCLVLFAIVYLFLPLSATAQLYDLASRFRNWLPFNLADYKTTFFVLSSFIIAMALWSKKGTVMGNPNWLILAPLVVTMGLTLILLSISQRNEFSGGTEQTHQPETHRVAQMVCVVLILIQLANISSPYLGGRSQSVFTMYSNLQTEGMTSNHFFLPRLAVETKQDDLVKVFQSSNSQVQRYSRDGRLMTWHELTRHLSADPNASIHYERNGIEFEHTHAFENPELVTRYPVAHRFLGHRSYDPQGCCQW